MKLRYSVPALADAAPLMALTRLQSAELEIRAAYPLPDILRAWPELTHLSLIREGKASKAVDLSALADVPRLQDLYVMGYAKGIGALADCGALRRLTLQSLALPSWDVLPPGPLERLRLNAVKGPDPVPFADLHARAARLDLIRMDRNLPFEAKRALSKVGKDGGFAIDIDYLDGLFDTARNGHDWAKVLEVNCPPPEGVTLDPEAGSLSVYGDRAMTAAYATTLIATLAMLVAETR